MRRIQQLLFHPRPSRQPCYLLKCSAEGAVALESAFVRQFCGGDNACEY